MCLSRQSPLPTLIMALVFSSKVHFCDGTFMHGSSVAWSPSLVKQKPLSAISRAQPSSVAVESVPVQRGLQQGWQQDWLSLWNRVCLSAGGVGGGVWHKASVLGCLPLAAPIGLSPLHILTLCGPERVLVVSTEPLDDLSCLTTPGVGCPGDGLLPVGGGGVKCDVCGSRATDTMAMRSAQCPQGPVVGNEGTRMRPVMCQVLGGAGTGRRVDEVVGTGIGGGGGGRGRQAGAVGGDWDGPIGDPHKEKTATKIGSERQTTGMSRSSSYAIQLPMQPIP